MVGEAATSLLGQIDDPNVALGIYPEDFQYGTGRLLDDTRDALSDAAEKALQQVFKRLDKTAKLLGLAYERRSTGYGDLTPALAEAAAGAVPL